MAFDFTPLTDQVTNTETVEASAVVALNGVAAKIQAAVDAALAAGATADQLAPIADVITGLKKSSDDLAAAITA